MRRHKLEKKIQEHYVMQIDALNTVSSILKLKSKEATEAEI